MRTCNFAAVVVSLLATAIAAADEPVRLQEKFAVGYQYRVSCRLNGGGMLTLPPNKDKPAGQSLDLLGKSTLEYDERILEAEANGDIRKTLRVFRQVEFEKTMGKDEQKTTVRPAVRRMVLLRKGNKEVGFSPDGPLTYAEIDLVRTDVFTPALAGLLPAGPVKPGDGWKATETAVLELTDFEKIEEGSLECKFDEITTQLGRRVARVSLTGDVRGVDEFGPARQHFDGHFYFDLQSNHLGYLTFQGTHLFLDKDGKTTGKIAGTFTLSRQVNVRPKELSDEALAGLATEPTDDTSLLLYENPDLGLRFLHSRAWKVAGVEGRQVMLDGPGGNSLMLTPLAPKEIPTVAQYQAEVKTFIEQQRGKVYGMHPPKELQAEPRSTVQFALEAEMAGERLLLDYYILKQKDAGATLSARLLPEAVKVLRPDVERIAKSVVVTK